jgi:hypothetical protein
VEIGNLAQWTSAFLSAVIAVLAIWGDPIRARLVGPRLAVALITAAGEKLEGVTSRYYHLRVSNSRQWAPARNVRAALTGLAREGADQFFFVVPLSGPLQLHWQHPNKSPQYPVVGPDHTCDLGRVEREGGFTILTYLGRNSSLRLAAKERMRVEIRALADNAESKPLFLEIAWDGNWSEDSIEMKMHLVIKPVSSLT